MVELPSPVVLIVMGVSGSGKSTIAGILAERLGWTFEEGDLLHPKVNIEKMAAGIPLTDDDRWPWLAKVADWIDGRLDTGENGIVACSALKRTYRNVLNRRGSGVEFIYLAVDHDDLEERVEQREGHFMPPSLLDSQLATLEPPKPPEPAIQMDAAADPQLIVDRILRELGLTGKTLPPAATPKKATRARKPAAAATAAAKPATAKPPASKPAAKRTPKPKS